MIRSSAASSARAGPRTLCEARRQVEALRAPRAADRRLRTRPAAADRSGRGGRRGSPLRRDGSRRSRRSRRAGRRTAPVSPPSRRRASTAAHLVAAAAELRRLAIHGGDHDQRAHPLRPAGGELERHLGAERGADEVRRLPAQPVEQRLDVGGVPGEIGRQDVGGGRRRQQLAAKVEAQEAIARPQSAPRPPPRTERSSFRR